jgi:hypothetical protein
MKKLWKRLSWFLFNGCFAYGTYLWLQHENWWAGLAIQIVIWIIAVTYPLGVFLISLRKHPNPEMRAVTKGLDKMRPFDFLPMWLSDIFDCAMTAFLFVWGGGFYTYLYLLSWVCWRWLQKNLRRYPIET